MGRLEWDKTGERVYETGVSHGVLYLLGPDGTYPKGVAWNGLTGVTESPSGAEANNIYADNQKYLSLMSAEEFGASIEAYTYPDEFAVCDGSAKIAKGVSIGQQPRQTFGLSYRSIIGNDTAGDGYGYKLHLIYGGKASPSEKGYQTVNDSPEAITFNWEVTTTPVEIKAVDPGTGKPFKPSACLTIDSTEAEPEKLKALEDILYGSEGTEAMLPLPDEVIQLFDGTQEAG